jgi:DNA-binding transcriptional ArsR family regulator
MNDERICIPFKLHHASLESLDPLRSACKLNHMVQYSQSPSLDAGFSALSDATRRGILERLGRGDASITDLAQTFEMTLTGMKKHVHVLESAGLLTSEKVGRVRTCRLGPRRLEDEIAWITGYRQMLEARLDRLADFLERTKGDDDQ